MKNMKMINIKQNKKDNIPLLDNTTLSTKHYIIGNVCFMFIIFILSLNIVHGDTLLMEYNGTGSVHPFGYLNTYEWGSAQFNSTGDYNIFTVNYWLKKEGSPTHTISMEIYSVNGAGVPDTSIAVSNNTIDGSTLTTSYTSYAFNFDRGSITTTDETSYAIVLKTSGVGLDESNFFRMEDRGSSGEYSHYSYTGAVWNPWDLTTEGHFNIYGEISVPETTVEGFLINRSYDNYNLNNMDTDDMFNGKLNYSFDGQSLDGGVCAWNTSEIYVVLRDNPQPVNITLDNLNDYTFSFSESVDDVVSEIIEFRLCRQEPPKRDVLVYVNSTLIKTIDSDIIPLCTIGFHEENILRSTNIGTNEDVLIECSTCINNNMRLISRNNDYIIEVERYHLSQNESMEFNTTDSFYYDDDIGEDSYKFNPGINYVEFICNGTSDIITAFVGSITPIASLLSLEWNDIETSFINGTITESSITLNITANCLGNIINYTEINITNSTGSLIKSQPGEFVSLTKQDLNKNGNYTAHFYCIDFNGNISTDTKYFQVLDTTFPYIVWNNPLNTNSTVFETNELFQIDVDVSDTNLFSYNLLVTDPGSNIIINVTKTDINETSEKVIATYTPNITGLYSATMTVSDDHTKNEIEDYEIGIEDNRDIQFNITEITERKKEKKIKGSVRIEYLSGLPRSIIEITKQRDRYNWKYNFVGDVWGETKHKIKIKCPNIIYREYSLYDAHFICPETNNWIDFMSNDIKSYKVKRSNDNNSYMIEIVTENKKSLEFNSIGGLNTISERVTFTVNPETTSTNTTLLINECPGTIEGVGVLFIIFLICLCFVIVALLTQNALFYITSGIGVLILSWTIFGCSELFGGLLVFFGVALIVYSLIKKPL